MSFSGTYGGQYGGAGVPPLNPAASGRRGNGPTANALRDRINIRRRLAQKDADKGTVATYTLIFPNLPCLVTPRDPERLYDENGRITTVQPYRIMLGFDPGIQYQDQVVWIDNGGRTHNISVVGLSDQSGRGAVFLIFGEEKL